MRHSPIAAFSALALLSLACTASDPIIISPDAQSADTDSGSAPFPRDAALAADGPLAPDTPAPAPHDAVTPDQLSQPLDALASDQLSERPDACVGAQCQVPGDAAPMEMPTARSCGQLAACGLGSECLCCPLGVGISNCTCSTPCTRDDECPQAAPHCNVKKLQNVAVGPGFCTTAGFICRW
jgi:hypothetical protein